MHVFGVSELYVFKMDLVERYHLSVACSNDLAN